MKYMVLLLAGLIAGQSAYSEVSPPFQINTAKYQDYRGVNSPLSFVGIAKVAPKDVQRFKSKVDSMIPVMRAQPGNRSYEYMQSMSDSTEFVFVEEWDNGAHLADHMDSAAVGDLLSVVGPMFNNGFFKIMILKKN